jgi:hypothetical protein
MMQLLKNTLEALVIQMFPDGRLDSKNAAMYLGLKEKTLAMMRSVGKGPKFIKRGRIFYFKEDLDNWINAPGKFVSTTQTHTLNNNKEDI